MEAARLSRRSFRGAEMISERDLKQGPDPDTRQDSNELRISTTEVTHGDTNSIAVSKRSTVSNYTIADSERSKVSNYTIADSKQSKVSNEKDLAVAVAVNDHFDIDDLPAAIEYDPHSKPPLHKNRRVRLYSAAAACLLLMAVVGTVIAIISNVKWENSTAIPTAMPTLAPTTTGWAAGARERLESLVGDKIYTAGPYKLALDWILDHDPMNLTGDAPNLVQRYLLALLFFSGDGEGRWKFCRPSDDVEDVHCEAQVYDEVGAEYVDNFSRFLSADHECNWYGVKCHGEDNVVREIEIGEGDISGFSLLAFPNRCVVATILLGLLLNFVFP